MANPLLDIIFGEKPLLSPLPEHQDKPTTFKQRVHGLGKDRALNPFEKVLLTIVGPPEQPATQQTTEPLKVEPKPQPKAQPINGEVAGKVDTGQIIVRGSGLGNRQTTTKVPKKISSILVDVFGNDAHEAASVLHHPMQSTAVGDEKLRGINLGPNRGENPEFKVKLDIPNPDGSIDRGLFRINSNTFKDFKKRKPDLLAKEGITTFDDMNDPLLNAKMAKIIQEEQGWRAWFAAPSNLRSK